MRIVILFSGGLDSLIMNHYASYLFPEAEIIRVFYNIGQPYYKKEALAIKKSGLTVETKCIDWLDDTTKPLGKAGSASGDIYIPGRNLLFVTAVACQYLPDQIWLGAVQGEIHSEATDKNFHFRNEATKLFQYVLKPFKEKIGIHFPLAEAGWDKLNAACWALQNGLTPQQLLQTSSCLATDNIATKNCGACIVCFRRWGIFKQLALQLNLPELIEDYETNPPECEKNIEIIREMIWGTQYDVYRQEEILPAFGAWVQERWKILHILSLLDKINDLYKQPRRTSINLYSLSRLMRFI